VADLEELAGREITGSAGTISAKIGDEFDWWDSSRWRIDGFKNERSYSPSGFGGCITVVCRHISGTLDGVMQKYTANGLCDWCADSVATALIRARTQGNPNG
jgi:hypothetical protein